MEKIDRSYWGSTLRDETIANTAVTFHSLIFCGIHVAAWNFPFSTNMEKVAWRVSSLTELAMLVVYYLIAQAALFAKWLKSKGVGLLALMNDYANPHGTFTKMEIFLSLWIMLVYILVRFGMVALVLSSFRALPSGAYLAVDWLASIPRI
ncbi:hypothetical protein BJY00DRAFT_315700 [Aspergillus carlsbadensis]|nr:hypothetical protein BJY00DRAFT_315700 [Aspergillus carlsbadensis]